MVTKKILYTSASLLAFSFFSTFHLTVHAQQVVTADTTINTDGQNDGILFNGDFELTVPDAITINSNQNTIGVATSTSGEGTLLFEGDATIYGTTGSSAFLLGNIVMNNSDGTVLFTENIFTDRATITHNNNPGGASTLSSDGGLFMDNIAVANTFSNDIDLRLFENINSAGASISIDASDIHFSNIRNEFGNGGGNSLDLYTLHNRNSNNSTISLTSTNDILLSDIYTRDYSTTRIYVAYNENGTNQTVNVAANNFIIDTISTAPGEIRPGFVLFEIENSYSPNSTIHFDIANNFEITNIINHPDSYWYFEADNFSSPGSEIIFNIGNDLIIDASNSPIPADINDPDLNNFSDFIIFDSNAGSSTTVSYNIGGSFIASGTMLWHMAVYSVEGGNGVTTLTTGEDFNAPDTIVQFEGELNLLLPSANNGENTLAMDIGRDFIASDVRFVTYTGSNADHFSPHISIGRDIFLKEGATTKIDGIGIVSFTGDGTTASSVPNGLGEIGGNNIEAVNYLGNSFVTYDIAANTINVGDGLNPATATYLDDHSVQGDLVVHDGGRLILDNASILDSGVLDSSLSLEDGSTLYFAMQKNATQSADFTDSVLFTENSGIEINIQDLLADELFSTVIINSQSGDITDQGVNLSSTSPFQIVTGQIVDTGAVSKGYEISISYPDFTDNEEEIIPTFEDADNNNPTGDMEDVLEEMGDTNSEDGKKEILREHIADERTKTMERTIVNQNETLNLVDKHINSIRTQGVWSSQRVGSGTGSGVATGQQPLKHHIWAKSFATHVDQETHDGVNGYTSNSYGLTAGIDKLVTENTLIGASLAYSRTNIRGASSGAAKPGNIDVNSYYANIYASHILDNGINIDGLVGAMFNDFSAKRYITLGAQQTLYGDFDGQQYTAKLGVSKDYRLNDRWIITPIASLQYTYVHQDGYTEKGGDGTLNQQISGGNVDLLESGLGLSFAYDGFENIKPEFRATWFHEYLGSKQNITAQIAGGPAFQVRGSEIPSDRLDLGVDLTYTTDTNFDVVLSYNFGYQEHQTSHVGVVKVVFPF